VGFFISRGGGIRTPGTRKGSPVFKTGAINRSTTPLCAILPFLRTAKVNVNSIPANPRLILCLLLAEIRKSLF
jgi:hypothetical protein